MLLCQVKNLLVLLKTLQIALKNYKHEPIVLPGPLKSIPWQSRGFCDVFFSSSHFTSGGGVSVQRLKTDAFNSPLVTAALGEPESLACFTEINKNDNQTNMQGWDRIKRNHKSTKTKPCPSPPPNFFPKWKTEWKIEQKATDEQQSFENTMKML